jgi:salicylate hydroxylase
MTPNGTRALPMLIAGGGIGGLATALALSKRGMASIVLEAAEQFAEVGAGLQIGPNGSRILRSWGLGEALEREAGRPERICIHDGLSGKLLTALPLGAHAERRYGARYYVAERRLLHRLLLGAVRARPNVTLRTGFRLERFEMAGGAVEAVAETGQGATGRALIGADGVRSRVRSALFGVEAGFSGRVAWRATAPLSSGMADDGDVHLWLGPKAHLVHYRCGPQGPFNAVAVIEADAAELTSISGTPNAPRASLTRSPDGARPLPPGERANAPETRGREAPGEAGSRQSPTFEEVAKRSAIPSLHANPFDGWAAAPREIVGRFEQWTPWPLMGLAPLARWSIGPVTLLGDAAHPLLPFLASGAVAAIEDAEMLASQMQTGGQTPETCFLAYERARIPRVRRIVQGSARMGEVYHMQGPMRMARNLALAATPPALLLSRNDWLYGYCAVGSGSGD